MKHLSILLFLLVAACSPVEQPESNRTVAAFEVTLRTEDEYQQFLSILNEVAQREGYHLDYRDGGGVEPFTINASIWRGDDEESMAHAMDFEDRVGRVWITFPFGENPTRSDNFRRILMAQIIDAWPSTEALPIMPNGALPLTQDLIRTNEGYEVRESAASRYEERVP